MASVLIVNARIVNEGSVVEGDVLIRHGRIEAIGALQGQTADQVLDAGGRYLLPGMIDSQSVCQNGFSTLVVESRAAVAGGVTTLLETGGANQLLTTLSAREALQDECDGSCHANFGFYLTATADNLETIKTLDPQRVCGINLFLGAGTDNAAVMLEDHEQLEQLFQQAAVPLVAHCEDRPAVTENEESYRGIYGDEIPIETHSLIHSDEAAAPVTLLALQLARKTGCRLQLMHVSSVRETGLLGELVQDEKLITAEVAVPWLHFCDEDYPALGSLLKLDPSVKTPEDRAGLIQGVLDGSIELIGSGHHAVDLAAKRSSNYFEVASGMPMLQHALITLLEHYHDGIFSLELIAEKTSHRVAERFGIPERGFIREGYWADLVLIDLEQPFRDSHYQVLSRSGWTPFDGYPFRSSIRATLVNGQLVYEAGQLPDRPARGMPLSFHHDA